MVLEKAYWTTIHIPVHLILDEMLFDCIQKCLKFIDLVLNVPYFQINLRNREFAISVSAKCLFVQIYIWNYLSLPIDLILKSIAVHIMILDHSKKKLLKMFFWHFTMVLLMNMQIHDTHKKVCKLQHFEGYFFRSDIVQQEIKLCIWPTTYSTN